MSKEIPQAGSPIKAFIEQTKKETVEGLGDNWELKAPIEFELSTMVKSEAEGKLKIWVVNIGADVKAQEIQKIKISIGPKDDVREAQNKVKILQAKVEERKANFDLK